MLRMSTFRTSPVFSCVLTKRDGWVGWIDELFRAQFSVASVVCKPVMLLETATTTTASPRLPPTYIRAGGSKASSEWKRVLQET